jgi:hypothetical protein
MIRTIKALTPATLSSDKYLATETDMADFREYAEGHESAVLREYEIEKISDMHEGTQNHQIELRFVQAELVMAYPHHFGSYQAKDLEGQWNERALRALADEDRNIIDKAIGLRGGCNYVAAQRSCVVGEIEFEELEGTTLVVLPLEVTYYHSSS